MTMSNTNYDTKELEDNTIYLSYCENSFPHKIYMNMKEEFWRHHLRLHFRTSKESKINRKTYSDNESNNMLSSVQDLTIASTTGLPYPAAMSTNNQSKIGKHVIPLSMDISTQFNSDMNIIIEQDINDGNIINIKFGGPIHGNVEGSGNMQKSNFLSLINESITEKIVEEISKSKPLIEKTKVGPVNINLDKKETMKNSEQTNISKKNSLGSEESINYFASTIPSQSIGMTQELPDTGKASENVSVISKVFSKKLISNDNISRDLGISKTTAAEYNSPFTNQSTIGSMNPSNFPSNDTEIMVPAILPKCIIQRISRAMINDLSIKKKSTSKIFNIERKITLLQFDKKIIDQNWHAAVKRGKIMIGEILELIITVNIDNITQKIAEIESILVNLKSELINSSFYLLSLTDQSQINDILCMQIIIDIVQEEINNIMTLAEEWIDLGCKIDFSTFFINKFTLEITPNNSEMSGNTSQSKSTSITKDLPQGITNEKKMVTKTTSQDSESGTNFITDEPAEESKMVIINKKISKGPNNRNEDKPQARDNQLCYPDPSLITNSRIKKTMNTIMQVAVEENLADINLSKSSRSNALSIEIINKKPIITKNANTSLIKDLTDLEERWTKPIATGKMSIQDLVEFIINTASQGKELSKELYNNVVQELNQLEKELLYSVANNLYVSRNSDKDLMSLCYEILAELIFEEISIAKYVFNSLDTGTMTATSLPLGKLYRSYIAQIPQQPGSTPHIVFKNSDNYAHQTSEVKNYQNISVTDSKLKEINQLEKRNTTEPDLRNINSTEQTISGLLMKSSKDAKKSEDNTRFDSAEHSTKDNNRTDLPSTRKEPETRSQTEDTSVADKISDEEKNALLIIIDKLNNQTREINKIKDNLQELTGKVDARFSQWKCNFSLDKVNDYCSQNNSKTVPLNLARSTTIHNTQEIIHPNEVSMANAQPSFYKPIAEVHGQARKTESTSYVAPISNKTLEQPITHKSKKTISNDNLSTDDILNLICEGSLNLLNSKNQKNEKLGRQDSCEEINIEFDKVFEWVVGNYKETLICMEETQEGKIFINSMNALSANERRKIEKDLITKIIENDNEMINNWVKEICYKKILNCLTPIRKS